MIRKTEKNELAVLVVSCDKYSDLWNPFFQLFQRFWPDCNYNVYLLTNNMNFEYYNVHCIQVGRDISWSDNLIAALGTISENYILMFIDDLFLYDYVKSKRVEEIFNWMRSSCAKYVRMNVMQKPDRPYNEYVGISSKGTLYRTSTVLSVWEKHTLASLLVNGENPWEFEVYGTVRSEQYDGFYSTWEDHFPVYNGVIKGKWRRDIIKKIELLGVSIDRERRSVMNTSEMLSYAIQRVNNKILRLFPPLYRKRIKEIVLRGHYNYKR